MPRQYTRLSRDEWKALLGLYQTGINTVEELAQRYKVSTSSIAQRARSAGIVRRAQFSGSAGIATATTATAALALPVADDGTTEQRIRLTNDTAFLTSLQIQRILEASIAALTVPSNPVEAAATVRALEQASAVLDKLNRVRRCVLRLDKGGNENADAILPELPIRDMTTEEVRALRAQQEREDAEFSTGKGMSHGSDGTLAPLLVELEKDDDRIAEGCEDEVAWP